MSLVVSATKHVHRPTFGTAGTLPPSSLLAAEAVGTVVSAGPEVATTAGSSSATAPPPSSVTTSAATTGVTASTLAGTGDAASPGASTGYGANTQASALTLRPCAMLNSGTTSTSKLGSGLGCCFFFGTAEPLPPPWLLASTVTSLYPWIMQSVPVVNDILETLSLATVWCTSVYTTISNRAHSDRLCDLPPVTTWQSSA
jgi:hypothetical protein